MLDNAEGKLKDAVLALKLAAAASGQSSLRVWLFVPAGILAMLAACYGVDRLFQIGNVAFPASVACLVVLFLALLLSEQVLGEHRTRRLVAYIEVPGGWSLRWIGVFFTPSFVLLPLSPPIGVVEVFKMIAVFVIGFLVMMAGTAYMTRGLQLAVGSSKRAITERAEEMGHETDEIPMTTTTPAGGRTPDTDSEPPHSPRPSQVHLADAAPPPLPESAEAAGTSTPTIPPDLPAQAPLPLPRAKQWAVIIAANLDVVTYLLLFVLVGIPVYYSTGYAMPIQLTFSILTYFGSLALPPTWRQFLHPVLVSALFTVLGIWVIGLTIGRDLDSTLREYKVGANYARVWNGSHQLPGAGDMFSTVLDASIIALALPMYQYRRELKQHFLAIVIPNVVVSVASLFAYPWICFAIGITAERSLAFASRSLTLALAIPATANLGGDANTGAAVAIMSGIVGVLIGQRFLALLKIPEDDYVTRGVTLGANSSAMATALLLRTDPRAAALSSLAMSLFGAITVLFTSIPPIANAVRSLVGL
ncbi:Plastidal glycolate/glycerate translocator-like protein [Apiospora aurea]|uniref:Plastidal glycolate/glycerate translocator-like protein n=1 Tax=Apiospora aurea TaxID=335848 RepID=A0ABR1QVP9_9PEZI